MEKNANLTQFKISKLVFFKLSLESYIIIQYTPMDIVKLLIFWIMTKHFVKNTSYIIPS